MDGKFYGGERRQEWDGWDERNKLTGDMIGIEDVKGMCERNRPDVLVCSCFCFSSILVVDYVLVFTLLGFRGCFEKS
jgi:hypothetical protein